jgi:PAS domain S-box-containing protein
MQFGGAHIPARRALGHRRQSGWCVAWARGGRPPGAVYNPLIHIYIRLVGLGRRATIGTSHWEPEMSRLARPHGNGNCPHDCLLALALKNMTVGVVLLDASGRILWMNRAAEETLGADASDCVGQPMDRTLMDPQLCAFWHDAMGGTENFNGTVSVHWPRAMELKVNVARCLDGGGTDVGRALLVCDVTSERNVQVELSQAVAKRLLDLTSGHMPPEPVAHLTQQELRMLRLVGRGLGNDEIADEASISASTVRSHLKSLYRKLSLNSRAEAVSFAVRHHLV